MIQIRPTTRRSQLIRLVVCLSVLVVVTVASLWQPVPPQFEPWPAVGSWKWWLTPLEENAALRPVVTHSDLHSIFFLPGQNRVGWAVGEHGAILHTEDGGRNWQPQASGTTNLLTSATFATPQSGWAAGNSGTLLHTEDGGLSWHIQPTGTTNRLNSVSFTTPQSGWAAGNSGTILHTEDGGRSWYIQPTGLKNHLESVTFATSQSGWVVGRGGTILHTENGGRSWQPQVSGTTISFTSVTFVTPQSGWAVGFAGTILHTEDGGHSWHPQASGTTTNLTSVTFVTLQSGWVAGEVGTILHTEDGGRSWGTWFSGTIDWLTSITFTNPHLGWTAGSDGTILHTEDGGRSWQTQASNTTGDLWSVTFNQLQSGWVVGPSDTILHTDNGGSTWQTQASRTRNQLYSVTFATAQSGWAVGLCGTILHTEDGGHSWQPQASGTTNLLTSATFATPQSGWTVGWDDTILHTEDGGRSWQAQVGGGLTSNRLTSVTFATPHSGWIAGRGGTVLHTEDGGRSWQPQVSGTTNDIESVTFVTLQSGWAVGSGGTILHTEDGGRSWQPQASGTTNDIESVTFVTLQSGWVVGENGTILHTEDGGRSWQLQTSSTRQHLQSVMFATQQSGWAVGSAGIFLHTEDGGISWKTIRQYHRWPAPWYYGSLALCLAALFWASLTVRPTKCPYVEDLANNDNPVSQLKHDLLGYRPMITRLLRFIQNPNTAPPLALCIQGPWGMGKSSAMRMLQSELQSARAAVTVWFNAWHRQKEDQLLAYLLEAIQKQVAPSWLSAVGLGFRFNLLRVRMFANTERFLAVVVALGVLVFHSRIAGFLSNRIALWVGADKSHSLSLLVVVSIGIGILLNQVRAFSADPHNLLESPTKSVWRFLRDLFVFPSLQGKTDVREEFEKNLREVTDALRPQRLVIFLDDLDRCRPEQVVQILEAINFLSSAAPCFIILGADYTKVETFVGMQFEHLAVQEKENAGADMADAAKARLGYARSYMKKVVNIRLNLPRPAPDAWRRLLGQRAEGPNDSAMRWQQGALAAILLLCVSAMVATAMGWIATPRSVQQSDGAGATLPGKLIASENPPAATPVPTPNKPGGPAAEPPEEKSTEVSQPTADEDRNRVGTLWGHRLTIGAATLLALIFVVIIFRRPKEIEKAVDSTDFVETLQQMAEQVYERNHTPREMRRFLNYLRLVAAPDDPAGTQPTSEAGLVRLAARGLRDSHEDPRVIELFKERCNMFGLNPQTFTPDEREGESAEQ